MSRFPAGLPTALALANPPRRPKRRRADPAKFPVFYDRSGKRLRRVVLATLMLLAVFGALVACMAPSALSPAHPAATDASWPREFLATGDPHNVPVIGDGPLTSLLAVEHEHAGTGDLPGPDPILFEPVPTDYDGDGVVDEMVMPELPEPPPPLMKLIDPITGEFIRYADDWETDVIGDSPYVVNHFNIVPDHTLILTFDDGPDPVFTGQILDILSREHVPAVFFVTGENVVKYPELIERIIREGHMIANHTFTHIDFDHESDFRNRQEIITTDRSIRAVADYDTRLFRMPYGDSNNNPLALLTGQQLGMLHVDMDLDTRDWDYKPGETVPVPPLNGRGHVVLMHDAGGTRAGTVAMLPKLIADAKAQSYTFTTLAPILPPEYVPQHAVASSTADQATLLTLQAWYVAPGKMVGFVFWFGVGSMLILTALYLALSVINEWRQRRKVWPNPPDHEIPFVSVILAAYNEDKVIARTLTALRESDYPASRFEVIAVNDGSKDATLAVLQKYAIGWPSLKVVSQANSGKSSALNNGVNHAHPRSTVIITMDADTLFRTDTIRNLARHFITGVRGGKIVGAVAGHVKVGNRRNVWTAWQSLEYLNGICIIRMAEMMVGAVGIVPGACSAWRRSALARIGGFSEDTLAEDADAAMTFQRLGYAVLHDNHAICDTEAPETIIPLLKQRKRWMFGNFQVMWKNKAMLFRPRYGALGMVTMPYAVAQLVLNILFLPILLVVGGIAVAQGDWKPAVSFAIIVLIMHTIIAIVAVLIARERWWHMLVVPLYRPIYEVMRVYLLYACVYRVIKGAEFAWDKLERRNSVVAHGKDLNDETNNGRSVVLTGDGSDWHPVGVGGGNGQRQADVLRVSG